METFYRYLTIVTAGVTCLSIIAVIIFMVPESVEAAKAASESNAQNDIDYDAKILSARLIFAVPLVYVAVLFAALLKTRVTKPFAFDLAALSFWSVGVFFLVTLSNGELSGLLSNARGIALTVVGGMMVCLMGHYFIRVVRSFSRKNGSRNQPNDSIPPPK